LRSNPASAAKACKTSLPLGVVVSTYSCRLQNPAPRSASPASGVDQVARRAAQPVELRGDQGVARAQLVQDLLEDRAVGQCAAGGGRSGLTGPAAPVWSVAAGCLLVGSH
jgi:hypothetical protein